MSMASDFSTELHTTDDGRWATCKHHPSDKGVTRMRIDVDTLLAANTVLREELSRMRTALEAAEKDAATARKLFRRYGEHNIGCLFVQRRGDNCDCGFSAAIAERALTAGSGNDDR